MTRPLGGHPIPWNQPFSISSANMSVTELVVRGELSRLDAGSADGQMGFIDKYRNTLVRLSIRLRIDFDDIPWTRRRHRGFDTVKPFTRSDFQGCRRGNRSNIPEQNAAKTK